MTRTTGTALPSSAAHVAFVNGTVHLGLSGQRAEAMLTGEPTVLAVGSRADVLEQAPPGTRIIDLQGRSVMPAFTDSHTHFHRAAVLRMYFLDFDALQPCSINDVLSSVQRQATDQPEEVWIQGDNLSARMLAEGRLPTRDELDRVSAGHPVILRTVGKHGIAANSAALAAAGITRLTLDPTGGRIERDATGEPTGVLHETAKLRLDATRADSVVPLLETARRLKALQHGLAELNRYGIAEIHEIVQSPQEMSDYAQLREQGLLTARVVFYVRVVEGQATLHDLTAIGLRTGFGDDWLRLGGIKISIDGSCTLHNAAVYEPYLDDPGNRGLIRIEQPELDELVTESARAGLQVAVHAIGPRAVDMALDALEGARQAVPESVALRHRIEHAYLAPRPGQLQRIRDVGAVVSIQPIFLWVDGDTWSTMFGAEAAERAMPMRSLLDLGIPTQINSDFPNAPVDPLRNVRACCERLTRGGATLGPREAVTVREAWSMATTGAAFSAFEESTRGDLNAGRLADLMVLSGNPYETSALDKLSVDATMVGGRLVYVSDELDRSYGVL